MKYGDRLKNLRTNKGLSQKELTDILNLNRSTYARYETSATQPDFDTLKKIANFFEVTTDYILGNNESHGTSNEDNQIEFYKRKIADEFPDVDLMFKDLASLTAEDLKEVYEYIKFKMSQKD